MHEMCTCVQMAVAAAKLATQHRVEMGCVVVIFVWPHRVLVITLELSEQEAWNRKRMVCCAG